MKKLFVPERIDLRREYLKGMGMKELRQFLLAALPGTVVTALLWQSLTQPSARLAALLVGMGYLVGCYVFFMRIENSSSMWSFVCRIVRFRRSQKQYFYRAEKEELTYVNHSGEET